MGLEDRRLTGVLGFAILAIGMFLVNPHYYGDATWYALDLEAWPARDLRIDAGHLLWRPAALALWVPIHALAPRIDPLAILRALSALGAATLGFVTFLLGLRLGLRRSDAFASAALVLLAKVSLGYGGSGCSYPAAVALGTCAVLPLVPRDGESWRPVHGAASAVLFVVAWGCWGVTALLLPVQFIAGILGASGSTAKKFLKAAIVSTASAIGIGALLLATYLAVVAGPDSASATSWLRASSHGVPPGLSPIGVARAAIGFLNGFLHLGDFGTSVKGLLLGDRSLVHTASLLLNAPAVSILLIFLLLGLFGILRRFRANDARTARIAAIGLTAVVPVSAFAILWKGSDVERFSLALPFLAVALVHGLADLRTPPRRQRGRIRSLSLPWTLAILAGVWNLGTFVVPSLATGGGATMALGRAAREHLREKDLVVVTGQALGADVLSSTVYFYGLDVYSVSYDVQQEGPAGWQERLQRALCGAVRRRARIAVLSDLLGKPTPGGIGLSPAEFPVPRLEEIAGVLSRWKTLGGFDAGRFTFLEISPPADVPCSESLPSPG